MTQQPIDPQGMAQQAQQQALAEGTLQRGDTFTFDPTSQPAAAPAPVAASPAGATPVQVEAAGDPTIVVQWRGESFTIPASSDDWPIAVTLAYEMGQGAKAVLGLIGEKRWSQRVAKGYRTRDLSDLSGTFLRQYGIGDAGE